MDTKRSRIDPFHFSGTLAVNVDTERLSDVEFRKLVRNTLPVVDHAQQPDRVRAREERLGR